HRALSRLQQLGRGAARSLVQRRAGAVLHDQSLLRLLPEHPAGPAVYAGFARLHLRHAHGPLGADRLLQCRPKMAHLPLPDGERHGPLPLDLCARGSSCCASVATTPPRWRRRIFRCPSAAATGWSCSATRARAATTASSSATATPARRNRSGATM